jgi:predicted ATP-dependent serine protease
MANCAFCPKPLPPGKTYCSFCGRYNTSAPTVGATAPVTVEQFADLTKVEAKPIARLRIGSPWDDIWGPPHEPGFVTNDTTLIAGFPGFGKTTLLLAFAIKFAELTGRPSYYVCSEQSSDALRRTIDRCGFDLKEGQVRVLVSKAQGATIDKSVFRAVPPGAIMLDSITDFCTHDDYKSQIHLCGMYRDYCREFHAPTFMIIQMNKQGDTAGLEKVQHDVDAILELESLVSARQINKVMQAGWVLDVEGDLRVAVMHKNRNGPTGIDYPLVMTGTGLKGLEKLSAEKRKSSFKTGNIVADLVNERGLLADELEEAQQDIKGIKESIKELDERIMKESLKLHQKAEKAKVTDVVERTRKKLVREASKGPDRAKAVEGEALKRKRAPMLKSKPPTGPAKPLKPKKKPVGRR